MSAVLSSRFRLPACTTRFLMRNLVLLRGHHAGTNRSALVLGCYEDGDSFQLTPVGQKVNNSLSGSITRLLEESHFKAKVGKSRTFYGLVEGYESVTVAGLGTKEPEIDENDDIDPAKENVRQAIGAAARSLRLNEVDNISIDHCSQASAAAEGAGLATHSFDQFKSKKKAAVSLSLFDDTQVESLDKEWEQGIIKSNSQNFARTLMETPSNFKYPELFVDMVQERFSPISEVNVIVRDEEWAKEKRMGCFLSVGAGSEHSSRFLELHYKGSDCSPVVLVGKGVTFDSGGISIKPSAGMGLMRGDMGGAACVLGAIESIAKMELPVNLTVLVPLVENMPSGSATNPGDVFTAMNGKTVEVDNTDAEGRLILADALCYAEEFRPDTIINVATLTGAMDVALGGGATGAFTTSTPLWNTLHQAGHTTGDRVWRMPLYKHYTKQMQCSITADLRNTQKKPRSAGSCTAAAFLKEFVTIKRWAHLDIAGVMDANADATYLSQGMTGRPTRTLIEAVRLMSANS